MLFIHIIANCKYEWRLMKLRVDRRHTGQFAPVCAGGQRVAEFAIDPVEHIDLTFRGEAEAGDLIVRLGVGDDVRSGPGT